jgi:putative transposase
MDGRGRALNNIFIERLWPSLKYELIYPGDFVNGADLFQALDRCFPFYNHQRPHEALGWRDGDSLPLYFTPGERLATRVKDSFTCSA